MATTSDSCQDSPLSVAASVIGIVTFVYAVIAGLFGYTVFVRRSAELYRSATRALRDNTELEEAISHSILLLRDPEISSGANRFATLLESYKAVIRELQEILIKLNDHGKKENIKKSFKLMQSKGDISEAEKRLTRRHERCWISTSSWILGA